MDDPDLPASPRKKHKAQHEPFESRMAGIEAPPAAIHPSENNRDVLDRPHKETECGITEFVSPDLPGFSGILKKRYTDFLVNEILPNGQVIHLDNLKKPNKQKVLSEAAPPASPTFPKHTIQNINPSHIAISDDDPNKTTASDGELGPSEIEISKPQPEKGNLNKLDEPVRRKETAYIQQTDSGVRWLDKEEVQASQAKIEALGHQNERKENQEPNGNTSSTVGGNGLDSRSAGAWQAFANAGTGFQLSTEDRENLSSFFESSIVDDIVSLYNRILNSPHRKVKEYGVVKSAPIDRDVRTKIHQALRRIFHSRLESSTNNDGSVMIFATMPSSGFNAKSNARHDNRSKGPKQPIGKAGWAELGGEYLHFSLYKENKDTMEAVSWLSKVMKMKPQAFQFAGTKDRRGVTVQRVSVQRVNVERMIDAGRSLKQAKIGNFEYHPQPLALGDLQGNEFTIALRDCQFPFNQDLDVQSGIEQARATVDRAVSNFTSNGFLNYYGLQRFGAFSTGTHAIGMKMLQNDFEAAVKLILSYHPSALSAAQSDNEDPSAPQASKDDAVSRDDKARASALYLFESTKRTHPALEMLPRKFSAEACLIKHLANPNRRTDYIGALQTLSRNLRLMYVHAYQSLVWNTVASARWKRYGDAILPGDLVLVNEHPHPSDDPSTSNTPPNEGGETEKPHLDLDGDPIIVPLSVDRAATADDIFTRARYLSETEASSGAFSIFDIVLPTPGFDILYPANPSGDIYKEFMDSEAGGGLDPGNMRRKWRDVSLSGSYRKLLAKPIGEVGWEVRRYGDKGEDEQFLKTDLEVLEGEKKGVEGQRAEKGVEDGESKDTGKEDEEEGEGTGTGEEGMDKLAVILRLKLGSSQYATMALRELMKEGGVKTWKMGFSGGR
ncbi:MAG: hypothetical protein Q9167_007570 [Letrouitia subvulpina]